MKRNRISVQVQISLNPDLLAQMDDYSSKHFLSRSGLISLAVSQYLNAQRMGDAMEELYKLLAKIADDKGTDEDLKRLEEIHTTLKMIRPDVD